MMENSIDEWHLRKYRGTSAQFPRDLAQQYPAPGAGLVRPPMAGV